VSAEDSDRRTSRMFADAFATITSVPNVDASDAEKISLETLFDAHHPIVGAFLHYSHRVRGKSDP